MFYGFTLNGGNCNDFGVVMISKTLPVLPASNDNFLQMPGRDGAYMFPGELVDGTITIECGITTRSTPELMTAKRQISAWVYNKQRVQLIFDDEPDKYWSVKYVGQIGLNKLTTPGWGTFTLVFRCAPQSYLIDTAGDAATFDSNLTWESDLSWDDTFTFPVTAETTVNVNNFGTVEVAPVITVTGTFTTLTLTVNGKTFTYTEALTAGQTLTIDNGKWNVTVDGVNKNDKWSGDMLVLAPGVNQVAISGTGLNCTVDFGTMRPKFL